MNHHKRPIPDDFRAFAPGKSINSLKRHYHAKTDTIHRWLDECGIPHGSPHIHNKRMVPDDFAQMAAMMHSAKLEEHYRAKHSIIARWLRESGIKAAQYRPPVSAERATPAKRPSGGKRASLSLVVTTAAVRTWGEADDAANKLRKFGPVSRCDENGRFDHSGKFWRVGRVVLTDAEVIERANRRRAA